MPATPSAPSSLSPARTVRARSVPKGQQTRQAILDAALELAARIGLEGLSIGALAERMQMSKSGVFAHFGSREELQISVIREYSRRFEHEVFAAAIRAPRGVARLQALFDHWMARVAQELQSGCIFISGAVEFDDRSGPVRDALASTVQVWLQAMDQAVALAQECGHLRSDVSPHQVAFEIHGLILAVHYEARFLNTPGAVERAQRGFAGLLARYGAGSSV